MDYKQWRGAMVRAMRQEREYGLTPQRGAPTTTRAWRAYELRQRRKQYEVTP